MKALLVVPRLPGTGHTGDRLRAELHLEALSGAGFDTVLVGGASGGGASGRPSRAEVRPVRQTLLAKGAALLPAFFSGAPLQSALFAGPWREALAAAGPVDLTVLVLPQRLGRHVAGALPSSPLVVDFVDALGAAARQAAASDPSFLRRLYWLLDAPRLERAERESGRTARVLFATTPFDAGKLPEGTVAVPNGVPIGPPPPGEREAVVAFTGRLRYRPNEIAVRLLVSEIWPVVRASCPGARLALGGADAPPGLAGLDGRDGIEVTSPVADMPAFLRRARVAAVPVALGTGTPNKLFEAFEAGCAVVALEEAAARAETGGERPPVRSVRTSEDFAAALVALLSDPSAAAADGFRGRAWVEAHADRRHALAALSAGYRRALGEAA